MKRSRLIFVATVASAAGCLRTDSNSGEAEVSVMAADFRAELELRIDGDAANLAPIRWLAVSRDGTIALVQRQDNAIRFFDAQGAPLGSFGRAGEGPGEFQMPDRMGWLGDTLWVGDFRLERITLISPERTLVRTFRYGGARPAPSDSSRFPVYRSLLFPSAVYDDGSILLLAGEPARPPRATPEGSSFSLLRVSADGVIQRLVAWLPPVDRARTSVSYATKPNGRRSTWSVPFYPRPLMEVSRRGDRIAAVSTAVREGHTGAFTVTAINADGDTIFARDYPFTGVPIPQRAVDSVMARLESSSLIDQFAADKRGLISDLRERVPAVLPPVVDLFVASDGRVWVGLYPMDEGRPWLILEPVAGDVVGTVVVPNNVSLKTADATRVWGLERDENDVESVVRYRLVGS